jgi:glycine dehydrogenase subunit 1
VLATKEKFVRQMPGRLAGQTFDKNGKRGFVLTLATREQHIRREKATSNICTNQALVALMVNIFMTVYGKVGLRELAKQNLAKTCVRSRPVQQACQSAVRRRAAIQRVRCPDQRRSSRHQLALAGTQNGWRPAHEEVLSRVGNAALWCCTELTTRSMIDTAVG